MNNNLILHWLSKLLMTKNSRTMDDETNTKRSKRTSCFPINYYSSINLMQFVEISPLDHLNKPHSRSGHRAVATESDFWIWGGYNPLVNGQPCMFNEV